VWLRCCHWSRSSGVTVGSAGLAGAAFGCLLRLAQRQEGFFPLPFQFGGHQPMVRVHRAIAPTRQLRFIGGALDLVLMPLHQPVPFLLALGQHRGQHVQLRRLQGLKQRRRHEGFDGRALQAGTAGLGKLLAQPGTEIANAGLVRHPHAVAALTAGGQPLQQRRPRARRPAPPPAAGGITLAVVVQTRLIGQELFPRDIGRIGVVDHSGPLCQGFADMTGGGAAGAAAGRIGRAAAVYERTGIGGVADHFVDGRRRRGFPEQLTAVQPAGLAPGQQQAVLFAVAQYLLTGP
jgi:hypothetical protein